MAALVLSIVAILISGTALGWQILKWRWEQRRNVKVEGRSLTLVSDLGEPVSVVGVRVTNENPRYPVRVNAVAFSPASVNSPAFTSTGDLQTSDPGATMWFTGDRYNLPRTIEPHDADTIDLPIDYISEVDAHPLGDSFTAWVELKTGDIFRSEPHPAP